MPDLEDAMLTTTDNPYNPFTQYDEWYHFDEQVLKHRTCSRLAYATDLPLDMPNGFEEAVIDEAMRELVEEDPLQLTVIVFPSTAQAIADAALKLLSETTTE